MMTVQSKNSSYFVGASCFPLLSFLMLTIARRVDPCVSSRCYTATALPRHHAQPTMSRPLTVTSRLEV